MAQQETSTKWNGPSARDMIASHTLAKEIIERHGSDCPVFDDGRIMELRKFIDDPSKARDILQDMGLTDSDGQQPGDMAASKGSLTGLIMARHNTSNLVFTEDEIRALKEWFDNGGGKPPAEVAAN